jgi:hypothetical protein
LQKSLISRFVPSDYLAHVQLTGDANSYTTGGFQFGLPDFQLSDSLDDLICIEQSGLYVVEWNPATLQLKVLTDPGTGLAEVANNGSTAGLIVDLFAFGR